MPHLWPQGAVGVARSVVRGLWGVGAAQPGSAGSPPLFPRPAGLAEVAAGLGSAFPPRLRHLASFTNGDVGDLRTRLGELLDLDAESWRALSAGARRAAVRLWSWDHVASRIRELAAVAGDDGRGAGR